MTNSGNWAVRVRSKYIRTLASKSFRRAFPLKTENAVISFSFDDFPQSALTTGGEILRENGAVGTYYVSLGLMGGQIETGKMFEATDLERLLASGHELGCHTFDHLNAWETHPVVFERSVLKNREWLRSIAPGFRFRTHSYPKLPPRPFTKRRVSRHFDCCRSGNQKINTGEVDSNHLFAFFLEKCRGNLDAVKALIDRTCAEKGWLILATHDVCPGPTPYGCTPAFFKQVVSYCVRSGASVQPVVKAWEQLSHNGSSVAVASVGHDWGLQPGASTNETSIGSR